MSEPTDESFIEKMILFPAIYDKSKMEHSNRDILSNSWQSLADTMNITVQDAKAWWASLVKNYRSEKTKRETETRSGSGASVKREMFPHYETMKDMLMTSHTTGPKFSNYVPRTDVTHQQQNSSLEARAGAYDYQRASGRSKKKQIELQETLGEVNEAISLGKKLLEVQGQTSDSGSKNPNEIVGRIVYAELEAMCDEESAKKRHKLQTLLNDHHAQNLNESEE